jgi:hypothetical protein
MSEILKDFADTRWHEEVRLVTWHPRGILDDNLADRIVDFMESEERIADASFHRYTDLDGLTEIRLSFGHAFQIAERRKASYVGGPPVKSAIYCDWIVGFGMARLYAELMKDCPIEVRAFRDRQAAAEWLGVPVDILRADRGRPASSEA